MLLIYLTGLGDPGRSPKGSRNLAEASGKVLHGPHSVRRLWSGAARWRIVAGRVESSAALAVFRGRSDLPCELDSGG